MYNETIHLKFDIIFIYIIHFIFAIRKKYTHNTNQRGKTNKYIYIQYCTKIIHEERITHFHTYSNFEEPVFWQRIVR